VDVLRIRARRVDQLDVVLVEKETHEVVVETQETAGVQPS
jgi:hypothetical protein